MISNIKSLLGPSKGYVNLLDDATTEHLLARKPYEKSPLRPSSAGKCTRELYHELMEFKGKASYVKETMDPNVHRLLNLGHSIEHHLLDQLKLLNFELRYKQQVLSFAELKAVNDSSLNQWFEGSTDWVFWNEEHKCVADAKSKGDKFNSAFKSKWDFEDDKFSTMHSVVKISDNNDHSTAYWVEDLDAFLEELSDPFFAANFLQLNLYANSQFMKERGVNHGAIIQYCKNDSRLREVRFKPSETLYNQIVDKMQSVVTAVDTGNPDLATRDYVLGSIKCAFCPFKKECWPEDNPQKAFFATFAKKEWPVDSSRFGKEGTKEIESLFADYKVATTAVEATKVTEQAIVKMMLDKEVDKIKFKNGEIYELKRLKNEIVLRRSKL